MQQRGQRFNGPWKETLLDAFGKERTDPCSLVWTVTRLSDLEISSCPLLQQSREQSAGEADDQAQEPQGIHPYCVGWRREWGWCSREGTGNTWVDGSLISI